MKKYIYIVSIISLFLLFYAGFGIYEKSHAQKTINVVSMTTDEMSSALKNETIEGFVSWEPHPESRGVTAPCTQLLNNP